MFGARFIIKLWIVILIFGLYYSQAAADSNWFSLVPKDYNYFTIDKRIYSQIELAKKAIQERTAFKTQSGHAFFKGFLFRYTHSRQMIYVQNLEIKSKSPLYWGQVQLLSRHYGCHIYAKKRVKLSNYFLCKDKRQIRALSLSHKSHQIVVFTQFDKQGYAIKVKKRKVLRVSRNPLIEPF